MEKLIVAGVVLVILVIYWIIKAMKGESSFDSGSLKTIAFALIIPIVAVVIFFIWLLSQQ